MVFVPGDPFGTNVGNTDNFVATSGLPAASNGMLPGYYVNGFSNDFVTSSGNFVRNAAYTQSITSGTTFTVGLTAGTDIVTATGVSPVLTDDPVISALRLNNASLSSGAGRINTVTFKEAGNGDMGGIIANAASPSVTANLRFGLNGDKDGFIYTEAARTMTMSADIAAAKIVKFGTGILAISKDQRSFDQTTAASFNWVVNEGQLTLNTFGASGTGSITLNGQATVSTLAVNAGTIYGANAAVTRACVPLSP